MTLLSALSVALVIQRDFSVIISRALMNRELVKFLFLDIVSRIYHN